MNNNLCSLIYLQQSYCLVGCLILQLYEYYGNAAPDRICNESVAMHYFVDKMEYVMKLCALNYIEQVETERKNHPQNNRYDEEPSILYEELLFCRGKKKRKYLMMLYVQPDTYPS